jgi:hypothetical protein
MKRLPLLASAGDPDGYGEETILLNEPEPTVQLPMLPVAESHVRITPGGMHRDWQLARHFGVGVVAVALVVMLLARQPVAPAKVVVTSSVRVKELKASHEPVVRSPLPVAPAPSFYTPPPPAMFPSQPPAASFVQPPPAPPYRQPPSNSARVEEPMV